MANKNKSQSIIIGLIIIIVLAALLIWGKVAAQLNANTPKMTLFYGSTCPHCKIVEDYMAQNKVRDRLQFRELEVFSDQNNAQLLIAQAKACNMDTTQGIGVPFFFTGQKCIMGDEQIIDYFHSLGFPAASATPAALENSISSSSPLAQ